MSGQFFIQFVIAFLVLCNYGSVTHPAKSKLEILVVTDKFPWSSRPFINNQIKSFLDKGHALWVWCTLDRKFSERQMPPCLQAYNWRYKISYGAPPVKKKFDVILCQFGDKGREALLFKKKKLLQGKIVTCFRGEDITARLQNDPHRYDALLQEGTLFLPVCHYFENILIALGVDPKKIKVIHSAIDCDMFTYQEHWFDAAKSINLISVNRLTAKKGTQFAIEAAVLLKKQFPQLKYTIVGDGPLMGFLQKLIEKLYATDYITLVGKLPHHKVADMLKKAHIFVLPSITPESGNQEGIPNGLMEAMAMGLPVVSTEHAGIPELVQDGESGFLVPERDSMGLIEKIGYLIERPSLCIQMGKKGRMYVEQEHNTKVENERLEQLLLALCNNQPMK